MPLANPLDLSLSKYILAKQMIDIITLKITSLSTPHKSHELEDLN